MKRIILRKGKRVIVFEGEHDEHDKEHHKKDGDDVIEKTSGSAATPFSAR